jgi:serine/threonine protein kinase
MAIAFHRIQAVFLLAAEATDPAARVAILDRECGGDAELRQRVEALLVAHDDASGAFLDRPPLPEISTVDEPHLLEGPGSRIGPYKLLQKIGQGGMGVVFLAEQLEPVQRKVALKVIKPGMDTQQVIARFEAERQALALMDHPNIARVLDAGATDSARPYFVMELVKGMPITKYCDRERLTPQERLQLFVPVCQAVQHAHQKGIIHRDLKPSNILIALYDGRPVPKVIDFGVAKATGIKLTDRTLFTEVGHAIGTWEYMAPEQAEMNNLDVDTRADIYALGATLYELLTGSPPFSKALLRTAAFEEMLRMIREVEPPRPSTKLSLSEELPSLATKRKLEPAKLSRMMRGDLDWIVMKCLEKERDRRYETANGFAADIQRHLAGEAVQAVPPSALYRLRRFARKNRAMLTTAAAFAALLVAAAAVSGWLAIKAHQAEAVAEERREEAEGNATKAKENLKLAVQAATEAMDARVDAEVRSLGLQVDFNLAEITADRRVGLLRLARPMDGRIGPIQKPAPDVEVLQSLPLDKNPGFRALREFVTAAVLFAGQDYAQLLPPITHDSQEITGLWHSPDYRWFLTLGADGTARTWETRTGRQIAILRKANERVVNCGMSRDGKTLFAEDETGVARFFSLEGGFLSQTPPRPQPFMRVVDTAEGKASPLEPRYDGAMIAQDRFLTKGVLEEQGSGAPKPSKQNPVNYAELWDITAAKRIARWTDRDGFNAGSFRVLGDGRWIAAEEGDSAVAVFAANDGKLAGRLKYPQGEKIKVLEASPSGRRILINSPGRFLRVWSTDTWQEAAPPLSGFGGWGTVSFWTDELVGDVNWESTNYPGEFVSVCRLEQPPMRCNINSEVCIPLLPSGDFVLTEGGMVLETKTGQRLVPPVGHKYHPTVTRFAADGRFVVTKEGLIDTRTERAFRHPDWQPGYTVWPEYGYQPGFGFLSAEMPVMQVVVVSGPTTISTSKPDNHVRIRLLPTVALNEIPADLLELWLQVVLRGALGPDGAFVKWDEPTWEQKRQELAAKPAPIADLPFPGYVANDRLYWLRREFEAAGDDKKQLPFAKQLLDRANAAGDNDEATRWRKWLAAKSKAAMPSK